MSEKVADGWEEKEGEKEVSSTYIDLVAVPWGSCQP